MAIDYGSKRVGIALSDESGAMGFPHSTLPNTGRLIDEVLALITQRNVGTVVMGESSAFDGTPNPIATEAKAFGASVESRAHIPVVFESEVLTTQEARRDFEGVRKPGSSNALVDASAAALILTSYLDKQRHHGRKTN